MAVNKRPVGRPKVKEKKITYRVYLKFKDKVHIVKKYGSLTKALETLIT